jgi:ribonuclease R
VKVMRVDLDERKIDFELGEGRAEKGSSAGGRAGDGRRKPASKAAGAGNTDVQKSRDVKKALLDGAKKGSGKAPAARGGAAGKTSSHRKGAPKAGAPASDKPSPSRRKAKR